MSDIRRFFQREMLSLQEEGRLFAQDFPEAARFLDPLAHEDRDPYVERLTEGVAFLTGRIREVQEAEQDGLTGHLLEIVAPDLEQPLPSIAVVQFVPRSDLSAPVTLPVGTVVMAGRVRDGIPCPFRLLDEVAIEQVAVQSARLEVTEAGPSALDLEFAKISQNKKRPWPDSIPVFLLGDAPVVWAMRFALLRRISGVQVFSGGNWQDATGVGLSRCDHSGYGAEQAIPSPLAHLRDFLCADERFRAFAITGLGTQGSASTLRLRFQFSGNFPRGMARAVSKDLFRLNTGVTVNRFVESCQPLHWDHTQSTLVVRAQGGPQREILDVVAVEGLTATRPARRLSYRKFASYRHGSEIPHYQVVRGIGVPGRSQVGIALGTNGAKGELENQYLSIQAFCSDGDHPHDHLQPGHLQKLSMENPPRVTVVGLTRPTQSFRPPPQADPRSRLLALAAGHFEGWMEAARLKDALRHLMWDPSESKRTLIEAIQEISLEEGPILLRGIPWRRMTVVIRLRDTTCTPETWDRLGIIDAFGSTLFGLALEETPIGFRTRLRLVVDPAGVELEWEN